MARAQPAAPLTRLLSLSHCLSRWLTGAHTLPACFRCVSSLFRVVDASGHVDGIAGSASGVRQGARRGAACDSHRNESIRVPR